MMTQTFTDDGEKSTESRVWLKFLHHAANGEVEGWRRWSVKLCLFFHIVSWLGGDAVGGGGGEEKM